MPNRVFPIVLMLFAAAFAGAARADYAVGLQAHERGDFAQAQQQFLAAARQGHAGAQFMLGRLHAEGKAVPQDYVQAHAWYNLAAANGHNEAAVAREELARLMTPTQLASAQAMAGQLGDELPRRTAAADIGADEISFVQRRLNDMGYRAGPVDGIFGPRTRAAIEAWQRDVGAPVTGAATTQLVAALREPPATPEEVLAQGGRLRAYAEAVQQELLDKGFYQGPITGKIDEATRRAIRTYQDEARLPVTGLVSEALLDHLKFARPEISQRPAR